MATPGFLFIFGGLVTIINIIMSCLMIRVVVRDRANLSEIFQPFIRYTGCYDAPYAYLDEDDLTSWPGVSRRMMFYFFYSLIVQPFLIFFLASTYGKLLTETMRIADNPELLDQDDQEPNKRQVHGDQAEPEKTKDIELPYLDA